MLLLLPWSALLYFVYLLPGKAITKTFGGHSSMTLNLSLPESFPEVWDDFKICESGILKTVSTSPRNTEKNYQIRIAKNRGYELTVCI